MLVKGGPVYSHYLFAAGVVVERRFEFRRRPWPASPATGELALDLVVVGPLQMLPLGEEEVISFSFVRSCFLNLARRFWNQT